ncbi:hypothetical protein D1007_12112 [Hordeum vulgare]|nr:hypothetical protein D1007_12112 [Hordeum vulgare]
MVEARWARTERSATRVAQMATVGAAGARRSPSLMVNAATGLEAQEQQGSSQPATEQPDGRTATPSLVPTFGSASCARPEMPHGWGALAMVVELLRYRPAPDRHNDWLQRIVQFGAVVGDPLALSCPFRPTLSLANDVEQDAPPPPPRHGAHPKPRQEACPRDQPREPRAKPGDEASCQPFGLGNVVATYRRLQQSLLMPCLLGHGEEEEEMLGPSEGPEPRETADE